MASSVYVSSGQSGRRSSSQAPPPPPHNSSSSSSYGRGQQQPPPPGSESYPPPPPPYSAAPPLPPPPPPGTVPSSSSSSPGGGGYGHFAGAHHSSYPQRPHHQAYPPRPPPPPPQSQQQQSSSSWYPPSSSSQPAASSQHFHSNSSAGRSSWSGQQPQQQQQHHQQQQHQHHQQQQQQINSSLPVKRETEEERRERKKREYEMKKQREGRGPPVAAHHSQQPAVRQQQQRVEKKPLSVPEKAENRLKRHSTFLCKIKFRNELPDPVSQPKLLRIYNDKDRYSKYSITSMEKNYKHKLYVEPDLGIPLDLLDLSVYNPPINQSPMDPADAELLVDDEIVVKQKTDNLRRKERPTDKGVAWLVKTTYISPVSMDPAKQSLTEKQAKELREQKEGRKDLLENINDREQQIQAIEESFKVSKLPPVHLTKPELKAVDILPLLPDFDRSGDQFVHVVFDTEPTGDSELYSKLDRNTRDEYESRAIVKSYSIPREDGKNEKFLAYMVPKLDEANDENDEIPYTWIREYQWDVRAEDARNNYVFCFGEDAVQYLPISSKLNLRKKKAKEGRSKDDADNQFLVPSSVTVRRRDYTDEEEYQRETMRRAFMEGPLDEEPESSKRKRPSDNEKRSSKRKRAYEEETRHVSEDDEDSI